LIFVTVGNAHNPFPRLVEAADRVAARLDEQVIVQSGHTPYQARHATQIPFLGLEEYEGLIARARIVVGHAGSGSVISAFRSGKPLILMPRRTCYGEHVNDHQLDLAGMLAADERVRVVHSAEELWAAIASPPRGHRAALRAAPLVGVLQAWIDRNLGGHGPARGSRAPGAKVGNV